MKLLPLIFLVDVLGVSFSTVPTARRFETHFDGACVSLFASELESFLSAEVKRALVRSK